MQADVLGERARLTPDRPALVVVETGERFSYRQLDERAGRCARLWRERLGLEKGDRVGILAHNRVEYLDAFFAAGKCGVIVVTLGTRLTAHELEHVVRDAGLSALIYDGAFAEIARELRERVKIPHWIALDASAAGDVSYAEEVASLDPAGFERTPCTGEDVYCLLYTSGTTGKPKGVMIPHRMVVWNGYNTACCWQLRADDVSPIFTPLYHAGGLMAFLVPIFTIGGTIVLHQGFDAEQVWRTIESEGATVILGVPTIWKMLMDSPRFAAADLSRVRWLISGGAPLPHYLIEAYQQRGVIFKQGFGMTEVGVNCFSMTAEESVAKVGSIGKPMMHTEVRLVDAEGREAADGEVGEMRFRGPHVCLGYWNNPEATAAALDAEGFFHSGDLARRDAEGFFYVAGREKDMIISGGVNVYPAEIEAELLLHPEVADAAVVGVPDATWGEVGIAFIVPLAGASPNVAELTAHLESRLARYKIPKAFRLVTELPRTAYGKVVKGELRERWRAEKKASIITHRFETDAAPAGAEVVLLLNGGMMSIATWEPTAAELRDRYRVLRCDFRGQLLSPGGDRHTLEDHAQDVVALLDELGLERVHVLGVSFGAAVGLIVAGTRPERVASLIAATISDRVTDSMRRGTARLRAVLADIRADGARGRFHDVLVEEVFSPEWAAKHRAVLAERRRQMAVLPETFFSGLESILEATAALDVTPYLPQISCPTLVVVAGGDTVMPPEHGRALAAAITGAELALHPSAGHTLVIEGAAWLNTVCLDFLARVAKAGGASP